MENKNEVGQHKAAKKLRVLITVDGRFLFCASDITALLNIPNGGSAVRSLCINAEKHNGQTSAGMRLMNYIPIDDVTALMACADPDQASSLSEWLDREVFPMLWQRGDCDDTGTEDDDDDEDAFQNDELRLIRLSDYLRHINQKEELYFYVKELANLASQLPPCCDGFLLKDLAERFADAADCMYESGDIPNYCPNDEDEGKLIALADRELSTPAESGYAFCEDCTMTSPSCSGARCCDYDQDAPSKADMLNEAGTNVKEARLTDDELREMCMTITELLESIEDDLHCLYGYLTRGM